MPSVYTSEKKTLGEFLSMTSPPLAVPEWQRSYSWTLSEVETFWQDLLVFSGDYPEDNIQEHEYFLGSVVIVNAGSTHIILDGQQRLATATILLSVIRDFLKEFKDDAAARTSQKYICDYDDAIGRKSFKLTLNRYDQDFFRREVQEDVLPETQDLQPQHVSHTRIRHARQFFIQRFREKYEELGGGEISFAWSLRIRRVLTDHVSVVAVSSTDEDNAANVFETLNDRGIGLSTPDLLRNFLLRRAREEERDEIIDCWATVLDIGSGGKVEAYLRHFWLSHNGDVKTRSLYREIKRTIERKGTSSLEFSRGLRDSALVYGDIISARDDDPEISRLLLDVSMLGAKILLPAVLSSFAVGNVDDKRTFLRALLTLFVRHNVIGNRENNRLETLVFGRAKMLRADKDFTGAIEAMKILAPEDEVFVREFSQASISRSATARYLLRQIELNLRQTGEVTVELPDKVHVEHVYPQNPPSDQRWSKHAAAVDRLGNLSLLSKRLNTSLKNKPFSEKRPIYSQSDLQLTKGLMEWQVWNPTAIEERQREMSNQCVRIWPFPSIQ